MREDCRFEADNFREMNSLIAHAATFSPPPGERCRKRTSPAKRFSLIAQSQLASGKIFALVQIASIEINLVSLKKKKRKRFAERAAKRNFSLSYIFLRNILPKAMKILL